MKRPLRPSRLFMALAWLLLFPIGGYFALRGEMRWFVYVLFLFGGLMIPCLCWAASPAGAQASNARSLFWGLAAANALLILLGRWYGRDNARWWQERSRELPPGILGTSEADVALVLSLIWAVLLIGIVVWAIFRRKPDGWQPDYRAGIRICAWWGLVLSALGALILLYRLDSWNRAAELAQSIFPAVVPLRGVPTWIGALYLLAADLLSAAVLWRKGLPS